MIHPSFASAPIAAAAAITQVKAATDNLAEVMQRIHGGRWKASINHARRVIIIWDIADDSPVSPAGECS